MSITGGDVTGTMSAKRVGIGTTAPAELLHLAATSSAAKIKITNLNNALGALFGLSTSGDLSIDNNLSDRSIAFSIGGASKLVINANSVIPGVNNAISLGSITNKFTSVNAVLGTIQTSDERLKKDLEPCDLGLEFIKKLKPLKGRYHEESPDSDLHYFFSAQQVESVTDGVFGGLVKGEDGFKLFDKFKT